MLPARTCGCAATERRPPLPGRASALSRGKATTSNGCEPVQIQDSTFLVTGGASGLGAATARRLAARGANVAIVDLDGKAGGGLVEEIGPRGIFTAADVTSEEQIASAVAAARRAFGAVSGAVNCAGVATAE